MFNKNPLWGNRSSGTPPPQQQPRNPGYDSPQRRPVPGQAGYGQQPIDPRYDQRQGGGLPGGAGGGRAPPQHQQPQMRGQVGGGASGPAKRFRLAKSPSEEFTVTNL